MYAVHAQYPARSCLCAFADELFLCSWGVGLICARVCGVCVRARANAVGVGADVPCSLHVPSSVCFSANDPNLISVQDSEATRATDTLEDPTVNQKRNWKREKEKKERQIFSRGAQEPRQRVTQRLRIQGLRETDGSTGHDGTSRPSYCRLLPPASSSTQTPPAPLPLAEHGLHHTHTYTHSSHRNRNRHS